MKKILFLALIVLIISPKAYAMKYYAYDTDGQRIYQEVSASKVQSNPTVKSTKVYDANGNRVGTYRTKANGTVNYYDAQGNRVRKYKKLSSGAVGVYDANGNRIGKYKRLSSGAIGVYDSKGNRVGKYKTTASGATKYYSSK